MRSCCANSVNKGAYGHFFLWDMLRSPHRDVEAARGCKLDQTQSHAHTCGRRGDFPPPPDPSFFPVPRNKYMLTQPFGVVYVSSSRGTPPPTPDLSSNLQTNPWSMAADKRPSRVSPAMPADAASPFAGYFASLSLGGCPYMLVVKYLLRFLLTKEM